MDSLHPSPPRKGTFTTTKVLGFSVIIEKVAEVRRKFKIIKMTRGLAFFIGGSLLIWALSAISVDHWNYTRQVLTLSRILSLAVLILLFAYFLLRPLFEHIHEGRIARYIEERVPELKDRLVSVVECGSSDARGFSSNPLFPLLLSDTLESFQKIKPGSLFSRRTPLFSASLAGMFVLCFAALQLFGPNFLRYATLKLYMPWEPEQSSSLYGIQLKPGNLDLPKGSELLVTASLIGFDNPEVFLYSRHKNTSDWDRRRMEPEKSSNSFGFLFLDITQDIRYYAQSGTVKSEEFSISVTEQSRVQQIDVIYHYPAYTGLPARAEEDAGEISAVKGTKVALTIKVSADVQSGRILLQDGTLLPLSKAGPNQFEGRLQVWKDSSYRIQLLDQSRNYVIASNEYLVRALADTPPRVFFQKPGRDKKVTQLEEVLTEVKAEDDFGVRSLEFHFSVNGAKENIITLFGSSIPLPHTPADSRAERVIDHPEETTWPGTRSSRSITAAHTFFLEEYKLEPGDLISYFAAASDPWSVTTSDIYFLEVRPFGKQYSQKQVSGESERDASAAEAVLSIRQKEILAATWRLIRDQKTFSKDEYSSNLRLVAAQQLKLQQQTQTLSERIQRRALTSRDKDIQNLSENLVKAHKAMAPARQFLSAEKPAEAVSPEQISLQFLLRAEAYFKQVQVAYGNMSAGQAESLGAQELENLFELELDKLKNQYETQQQRGSTAAHKELDEALQKLKELAQRQQQQLQNKRRQLGPQAAHSPSGLSSDQQSIEQEAEKLARQLERLSRDMQDATLNRASQQMRQAAQELRSSQGNSTHQEAANRGLQALSRLNEIQQLLDRKLKGSLAQDVGRLRSEAQNLRDQQERVQRALESLAKTATVARQPEPSAAVKNTPSRRETKEKQQILHDKSRLAQSTKAMEQDLLDIARNALDEQKTLSQKLQAAANFLRDSRLEESVLQGSRLISRDLYELAQQSEKNNLLVMKDLEQRLESAEKSMLPSGNTSRKDRLSEALNRTDDLVESLESLSRRIQELQQARLQKTPTGTSPSGKKDKEGRETSPSLSQNQSNVNFGDSQLPPPSRLSDDTLRQLAREYEMRIQEAQDLSRPLRGEDELAQQLKNMIERMQQLRNLQFAFDPQGLDRLRWSVIDRFHQLELQLSKNLQTLLLKGNLQLAKDEEIPLLYRNQVEEYYKALSRK